MSLRHCRRDGLSGYKWGENGFCYTYTGESELERVQAETMARLQGVREDSRRSVKKELLAAAALTGVVAAAGALAQPAPPVIEPKAHPNCYCYKEIVNLADGTPVWVWRSMRLPTTCELCLELDHVIISDGPYLGEKIESS